MISMLTYDNVVFEQHEKQNTVVSNWKTRYKKSISPASVLFMPHARALESVEKVLLSLG